MKVDIHFGSGKIESFFSNNNFYWKKVIEIANKQDDFLDWNDFIVFLFNENDGNFLMVDQTKWILASLNMNILKDQKNEIL